jgi:Ribonuclease G/E
MIKIRGIYATALTKLFLDQGFSVVQPSTVISRRFDMGLKFFPSEVLIKDREDKQGIVIVGKIEEVEKVIQTIKSSFIDAIVREISPLDHLKERSKVALQPGFITFEVEFPYLAKSRLDRLRNRVTPTVWGHHRFKTFASELVDEVEEELQCKERKEIEERLKKVLYLKKGKILQIEHVKPEGRVIRLRNGEIIRFRPREITLLREFSGKGGYDGLDIPKEKGDFGITRIKEGSWIVRHAYYSKDKNLKGEIYNINTPVELYPDRVRYVDLHIDVVRREDEVKIIDEKRLEEALKSGYVNEKLASSAKKIARAVVRRTRK